MTCKECFHFKVCDSGRHIGEYIEDDGIYSEGVEKECITFIPSADVVEVVRCKDCKHYSLAMLKCCFPLDDKHTFDEYVPPIWQPNDYCSYGERREE